MRGYFDVDCRELSEDGSGWVFRPRVEPIAEKVLRLYDRARRESAPIVATTCGSGRMPSDGFCPGGIVIPLDPAKQAWRTRLAENRFFHVEKTCGSWRAFEGNPNAARLFLEMGIVDWVVFGNGLDLCVDQAVQNLLSLGLRVTFLSDVLIPSAKGNGPQGDSGTPRSRERTLARWRELGARETTLDAFLGEPPPYAEVAHASQTTSA
jgi:nicotinamidase-related amidase